MSESSVNEQHELDRAEGEGMLSSEVPREPPAIVIDGSVGTLADDEALIAKNPHPPKE